MDQTFWNTVHGHPFRFENMRAPIAVEAFGTETRLSFHVEPIIPFMSVIYLFWQHVETLLVMQTLAVASGAVPVRLLANGGSAAACPSWCFPLAYLLFPALEASNLYEFHPVTFVAPLLLWAFYFADARRYTWFALAALAAMGCKEELGILVAVMGLWIALRNGDRKFGVIVAIVAGRLVPHRAVRDRAAFPGRETQFLLGALSAAWLARHSLSSGSGGGAHLLVAPSQSGLVRTDERG